MLLKSEYKQIGIGNTEIKIQFLINEASQIWYFDDCLAVKTHYFTLSTHTIYTIKVQMVDTVKCKSSNYNQKHKTYWKTSHKKEENTNINLPFGQEKIYKTKTKSGKENIMEINIVLS